MKSLFIGLIATLLIVALAVGGYFFLDANKNKRVIGEKEFDAVNTTMAGLGFASGTMAFCHGYKEVKKEVIVDAVKNINMTDAQRKKAIDTFMTMLGSAISLGLKDKTQDDICKRSAELIDLSISILNDIQN